MTPRLALYTFGVFAARAEDPVNDGFYARNDPIFEVVDRAPGLLARSGYPDEPGPASWGEQVFPRFYVERGDGWSPATLSLWCDIEHAMAFSYSGLHAEALRHGREWFVKPQWPPYAAWWTAEPEPPSWREAAERHEHLHDHGPSPRAFSFRDAFDAQGKPAAVDSARIRAIAAEAAAAEARLRLTG